MRTGDRHEPERTDLSVGRIEGSAVAIEGLPEALRVESGVAETSDERGDDLRRDPTRVVFEEPEEAPPLDQGGEGVHVADVDQDRAVATGRLRHERIPQRAEDGGRAGVHEIDAW